MLYFFDVETGSRFNQLSGHLGPVLDVCWAYDESLLASCDTEVRGGGGDTRPPRGGVLVRGGGGGGGGGGGNRPSRGVVLVHVHLLGALL